MNTATSIPPNLLAKAKRLNPFASFPNKPGEGAILSSYFIGDTSTGDVFYFATAKSHDGRLYLIHHIVDRPLIDAVPNILLQSPYLFMTWNEKGKIIEWAAGQQK
ncbi:hypothetical protein [Anaeromicrobium sediminis]|uniref:Uncharacterized protein n=1 Tax=Anaeromicrobium sediminis TaxID=1478221 RepID=A0A267MP41_9FIRM|nr:hypothetical protein [Anaeromicrobium sediminis]PAB61296.1 hypothetical protein CCE28_02370 [Anaeromicrobium sediminis]